MGPGKGELAVLWLEFLMEVCQEEGRLIEDLIATGKAAFAGFLLKQIHSTFELCVRDDQKKRTGLVSQLASCCKLLHTMTFHVGREDSSLFQWLNEVGQAIPGAHNAERILTSIGTGAPTSPLSLFSQPGTNPLTWIPTATFLPLVVSPLYQPFPLCYQGEFSATIMPQFPLLHGPAAGSLLPDEEMCHYGSIHLSPVS